MFCPQCGSTQNDDLKFCKSCGANLHALRRVMASRDESDEEFSWNKTWLAEMFMSSEEQVRRKATLDRLQGKTPETRRQNEIKAGIILASTGVGLMIFLFALMGGIIAGGVSDKAAAVLSRIWLVGVIPIFIGLALIANGMWVSKKGDGEPEDAHRTEEGEREFGTAESHGFLPPPADTNPLGQDVFSVTDETTKHLKQPR